MKLNNITKIYNKGKHNEVVALKNISYEFKDSKLYAIMGRSGSGKTTLINIIGLMDNATSGSYILNDKDVFKIDENTKAHLRNKDIGFIFQSFYLEPKLTAIENVILPTIINSDIQKNERKTKAQDILERLGLWDRINHYPHELSGGEQQRVAIARALINNPKIIIADEPTGNLDSKNELEIFEMLKDISKDGKCVIVVSHNEIIKNYADEILYLNDGVLSQYEQ